MLASETVTTVQEELVQVCIHAHFYQPPRENPFTGIVPSEGGAEPYANFNEKITAECYRPNAMAGNFEHISFNFGPTLAAWLEQNDPETYQKVIAADKANYAKYGYGNAIAQVYNHVIMPLAHVDDARMQIEWGITDFVQRFGHKPEGMWLAETAVNFQVLELLAEAGIKFTILAPWQAHHDSVFTIDPGERAAQQGRLRTYLLRELQHLFNGDERLNWAALEALERATIPERFNPNEPYRVTLRNGKSIVVFFYNGPLSGGISFDQWATINADTFARDWILPQVNTDKLTNKEAQLITIATDGELYGHHQSYRELFLQHLVTNSTKSAGMGVTFLSHWLHQHPPRRQVRIVEGTSWSCFHGVKRWNEGCDCTPGDPEWKGHLRAAFDLLATETDRIYANVAPRLFNEPHRAIREWLLVYLGKEKEADFAKRHLQSRHLKGEFEKEWGVAKRLLQAQIYKHQMYTSCAWFFEDIDRIEPKNALAAASITFHMLGQLVRREVRHQFEVELSLAKSNHRQHHTGLQLYRKGVRWSLRHAREVAGKKGEKAEVGG